MKCPNCNAKNPERAKFCLECGEKLSVHCPKCNAELLQKTNFCPECGAEVTVLPLPVPSAPMTDAEAHVERLKRLVPKEYAERLLAGGEKVEGERRMVTILFSDVKGSTVLGEHLDPEDVMEVMNGVFDVLIGAVCRYEGTLARLMGDAILAFFGAPVAHEDDPERAVRCALEIIAGVEHYAACLETERGIQDFNVRVGINTGLVVVDEVGSDLRVEYTAMGDAINLAARMEQNAPVGGVLISHDTFLLVQELFDIQALGPVMVKGKSEAVQVYQVLGARVSPGKRRDLTIYGLQSPMVGRDKELTAVQANVTRLLDGSGGVVGILGEAGLGKSRLLAEVRTGLNPGVLYLEGHSLSFGQTISYWPFLEILRSYAGISEDDSEVTAWYKLEREVAALFPETLAEIVPYLGTLLALDVPEQYQSRLKYLDGDGLGKQIFLASWRFFERQTERQPVVLVFEDLHWMDESSLQLVEHLLPLVKKAPLLIVGLSRPRPETPAARLREKLLTKYANNYTDLRLAPLSPSESEQLVSNLLVIENLPQHIGDQIITKTEGNPFFLEEILRMLIETGAVVRETSTGQWRATAQVERLTIPDTVQGVIMARLDRLEEQVRGVLRLASVIGRSFLYRVLRALDIADQELDDCLSELQVVELIREKQIAPELEYIFRHTLAQEVTYESILLRRRRELHTRVGEVIEMLFAERLEEFYGLLAYHYAKAECWEKALAYLFKAGDQAGRMAADAEALEHYRQAMIVYGHAVGDQWDPLQRAQLEHKMGAALMRRGEHQLALQHLQSALAYLGKPLPTSKWGVRLSIMKELCVQTVHYAFQGRFVKPIADIIDPLFDEVCRLYVTINLINLFSNPERFLLVALTALNLSESIGSYKMAEWVAAFGFMLDTIPAYWLAEHYHCRARAMADTIERPDVLVNVYGCSAQHSLFLGKLDKVMEYSEQAIQRGGESGLLQTLGMAIYQAILVYSYQGYLSEALLRCQDLIRSGQEGADTQLQCWGLGARGFVQNRIGQFDEAIESLQWSLELAQGIPDQCFCIAVQADLGRCYLYQGRLSEALDFLKLSQECFAPNLGSDSYASLRNGTAEAYLLAAEQSRPDERPGWLKKARRACREALKQEVEFRPGFPEALRLSGTYEWLRSKPEKAQQAWQRSLALAGEMGQRYDAGLAHLEIGQRLNDRVHLEQAVAILGEVGAKWAWGQAKGLLAEISGDD